MGGKPGWPFWGSGRLALGMWVQLPIGGWGNGTCASETRKNLHEMSAALAIPGEAVLSRLPNWARGLLGLRACGPAVPPAPLAAPAFQFPWNLVHSAPEPPAGCACPPPGHLPWLAAGPAQCCGPGGSVQFGIGAGQAVLLTPPGCRPAALETKLCGHSV